MRFLLWIAGGNPYNITANQIGLGGSQKIAGGISQIISSLMLLLGMLSIVFIVVGGIQMAASNGDPKRFAQARNTVLYAVVGLVIAISAFAIVSLIGNNIK